MRGVVGVNDLGHASTPLKTLQDGNLIVKSFLTLGCPLYSYSIDLAHTVFMCYSGQWRRILTNYEQIICTYLYLYTPPKLRSCFMNSGHFQSEIFLVHICLTNFNI